MRYLYIVLILLFTAAVLLFKFQNIQSVTVTLLTASVTLPLSVLVIGVYLLGMVSGTMLLSVLRRWMRGAMPHR